MGSEMCIRDRHVVNRENALQTIEKHRTSFVVQKGRRGEIVDAKGNVLASSRSHWVLGLDPLRIDARDKSLVPQMASLLGIHVDALDERPRARHRGQDVAHQGEIGRVMCHRIR